MRRGAIVLAGAAALSALPVRAFAAGAAAAGGGLAALLLLAAATAARAADTTPAAGRDASGDAAWLQSVQEAARRQSFSGTIVYQRGNEVHTSRVVQSFTGTESRERVLTLDGQAREIIRQGDEVRCLYPRLREVVVEHGGARTFPAFVAPLAPDVLEHYEVRREGSERVAGSGCDVVMLQPRDKMRFGYRLCIDPVSSLMFKAQTLAGNGAVLEQVYFTDVHVGEPIDPAQLKPTWSTEGWAVKRQETHATELRRQGWSVTPPSGFQRIVEVMRNFMIGPDRRQTLQAVYSDGLATVSVFIEPGAPVIDEPEETEQNGAVTALTRNVGDARVTVVGEVPPDTAESIAGSVVHTAPAQAPPH